jgi:hypothetical protein
MNATTLWNLETAPWYALAVYWVLSALRVKPTKVKEGAGGRLLHIGAMALVFLLLGSHRLDVGFLGRRFVPESSLLRERRNLPYICWRRNCDLGAILLGSVLERPRHA